MSPHIVLRCYQEPVSQIASLHERLSKLGQVTVLCDDTTQSEQLAKMGYTVVCTAINGQPSKMPLTAWQWLTVAFDLGRDSGLLHVDADCYVSGRYSIPNVNPNVVIAPYFDDPKLPRWTSGFSLWGSSACTRLSDLLKKIKPTMPLYQSRSGQRATVDRALVSLCDYLGISMMNATNVKAQWGRVVNQKDFYLWDVITNAY